MLLLVMAFCSTSLNFFINATWVKYSTFQEPSLKTQTFRLDLILMIAGIMEAISGLLLGGIIQRIPLKRYYIC